MNRIDRVSAILVQLQSRRVVKAQDIAVRFGMSLRTVYRDIKTLQMAGVPLIGESGIGYSIMEGYRLPPVMFTKEEATAFLTAEKLVEKFTDRSTRESYYSAMFNVEAVLRSSEKDLLEHMEEHIQVLRPFIPENFANSDHTLQPILKCIAEKKLIHIRYASHHSEEITERDIEPIGIFLSGGHWHTIGFCRLRKDYRDFRTDRILRFRCQDETFNQEHLSLRSYLEKVARKENLQTVSLSMNARAAKALDDSKYYFGYVSETREGDRVEMNFLTPSLEGFARWFLMFADSASIEHPDSLRQVIKEFLQKLSMKHDWLFSFSPK